MIARLFAPVAAVAAIGAILSPIARAAPISRCTPTRGTIVAVDFGRWGGPVVRGCGLGAATGFDLLHAAGFTTVGDQRDGPAYVCRIGNAAFDRGAPRPSPDQDPCVVTPPADATWSFWLAPAGQDTWSYSSLGAISDVPKAGEVELWQFGSADDRPTISPATLRAPPAARPARTPASTPASTPTPTSTPTSTPTPTPTHPTGTQPSSPTVVGASPTSTGSASSGSATPTIVAVVLVVLLGGGGGITVWRRRRSQS